MSRYPQEGKYSDIGVLLEPRGDFGTIILVDGAVFTMMDDDWVQRHAQVPFFLTPAEIEVMGTSGLGSVQLTAAIERFIGDERVFEDNAAPIDAIRTTYRDLLMAWRPDFWPEAQQRLGEVLDDPPALAHASRVILGLWPSDPRQDPQTWRAWLLLGIAFSHRDDPETAGGYLEQALRLNPQSTAILNELTVWHMMQGREDEAERVIAEALAIDPADVTALCNAAGLRLKQGRKDEAMPYLDQAEALNPHDAFVKKLLDLAKR